MFDLLFLFLYCKDTTKSNNRQIFKGKSYCIVYYLTFINRKIKYYYYFMYYLLRCYYNILYISYYITYLIIYIERTKANREGKSKETDRPGRKRTRAAPRRSAIMPASSPSSSSSFRGEEWKSKGANETEREGTRAKDAADLFARPSPLFCSG